MLDILRQWEKRYAGRIVQTGNINAPFCILRERIRKNGADSFGAASARHISVENTDFFTYDSLKCKANNTIFRYKISVKSDYSKYFGDEA